jgi:hypothetical protein
MSVAVNMIGEREAVTGLAIESRTVEIGVWVDWTVAYVYWLECLLSGVGHFR